MVTIVGSVWWLQGGETKEEGTEFPPDLLLDLLRPAVSIKRSPQGLTGMSSEEELRTLGLSSLDPRRLKGDLIAPCSFLRRGHGEGGAELYFLLSSDRTRGSSSELCQGRFAPDIWKHFSSNRMVRHGNRVPREVIDAPSLLVFKRHLDGALNKILYVLVNPEVIRQLD